MEAVSRDESTPFSSRPHLTIFAPTATKSCSRERGCLASTEGRSGDGDSELVKTSQTVIWINQYNGLAKIVRGRVVHIFLQHELPRRVVPSFEGIIDQFSHADAILVAQRRISTIFTQNVFPYVPILTLRAKLRQPTSAPGSLLGQAVRSRLSR
jgi:hypothetical protein